jgi:uncharacterized protein YbgA (DUF1722 family)/uncharacterized protein YbbK (DUF523 family)
LDSPGKGKYSSRPRLVVSRCLGFERCRWNGLTIASPEVDALRPHAEIVTVCPEVEVGLGVPRDPVRIVGAQGAERLVQPSTGRDITDKMISYAAGRLAAIGSVDGFILKSRSPSCGVKDARIFPSTARVAASGRTTGLFAREVVRRFPGVPVEDEGRLTNFRIREHFLEAVFTVASFRELRARAFTTAQTAGAGSATEAGRTPAGRAAQMLTEFHAANKLLLMAHSQAGMRRLGRIAANSDRLPLVDVFESYAQGLESAVGQLPRPTNVVNVLMHAMGYFKDELSSREKRFFLDLIDRFRRGRVPLSAVLAVLREWIARFDVPYLEAQTFFAPFPEALASIRDSGPGR